MKKLYIYYFIGKVNRVIWKFSLSSEGADIILSFILKRRVERMY